MKRMAIRRVRESDAEKIAEIYNEYVLRSTISFETERVRRKKCAGASWRRLRSIPTWFTKRRMR